MLTILSRLKTRCSATSITSARPTASLCRNFARFDISVEFVSVPLLPCSGRPCVRHPWKVLQPPTEVWIHELSYYHCPSICPPLNRSNLTAFFGPLPKCTKSKMTDVTQSTTWWCRFWQNQLMPVGRFVSEVKWKTSIQTSISFKWKTSISAQHPTSATHPPTKAFQNSFNNAKYETVEVCPHKPTITEDQSKSTDYENQLWAGLSAKQGESCRSHRRPQAARGRTATSTRRSRRSATSTPPASTATRHLASAAPASFGARSSWLAPDPTSRRGLSVRLQSSTSSSAPTRGCGSATTTDFRIPPTAESSTSASRTRLSTRRPATSRWPSTMQQGRASQRRRCRAAKTSTTKKMIERLESSVILNAFWSFLFSNMPAFDNKTLSLFKNMMQWMIKPKTVQQYFNFTCTLCSVMVYSDVFCAPCWVFGSWLGYSLLSLPSSRHPFLPFITELVSTAVKPCELNFELILLGPRSLLLA